MIMNRPERNLTAAKEYVKMQYYENAKMWQYGNVAIWQCGNLTI